MKKTARARLVAASTFQASRPWLFDKLAQAALATPEAPARPPLSCAKLAGELIMARLEQLKPSSTSLHARVAKVASQRIALPVAEPNERSFKLLRADVWGSLSILGLFFRGSSTFCKLVFRASRAFWQHLSLTAPPSPSPAAAAPRVPSPPPRRAFSLAHGAAFVSACLSLHARRPRTARRPCVSRFFPCPRRPFSSSARVLLPLRFLPGRARRTPSAAARRAAQVPPGRAARTPPGARLRCPSASALPVTSRTEGSRDQKNSSRKTETGVWVGLPLACQ